MAKLSDLGDLDAPLPQRDDLARERSNASLYLELLRAMLDDDAYSFAWGTLASIRDQVDTRQSITQGQIDAVENIKDGGDRHQQAREGWERHERRTGRRYDGWSGRQR